MENNKKFRVILTPDKAIFCKECSITGKLYKVEITRDEYNRWGKERLSKILKHRKIEEINFIINELTPTEYEIKYPIKGIDSYKEEE